MRHVWLRGVAEVGCKGVLSISGTLSSFKAFWDVKTCCVQAEKPSTWTSAVQLSCVIMLVEADDRTLDCQIR